MTDNQEFAGRSAIVTGGSRGIGHAVARLFAARGASLVLVSRDPVSLAQAASTIADKTGGRVEYVAGDAADPATASAAVAKAMDCFGRLDILANIAGVFPTARIEDTDDALFAETVRSNFTATFVMCRAAIGPLRASGAGAIVNMSSTAARLPTPGLSVYGGTKAAIEAFSRALAAEGAPGVRVNCVSAGPTLTETVAALMAVDTTGAVDTVVNGLPIGRLGTTGEIAEAVLYLASPRAGFVTGQVLHANGGGVMA